MDLRVFYLMNGQIIFAEFIAHDDDTDDYIIQGPVMVMLNKAKIGMTTAYPFSDTRDPITLNWRQVIANSSLDWNPSLIREYGNFWAEMKKKQLAASAGIDIVPAGAGPDMKPGLGIPVEKTPMGPRPSGIKQPMGPRPSGIPPLRSV